MGDKRVRKTQQAQKGGEGAGIVGRPSAGPENGQREPGQAQSRASRSRESGGRRGFDSPAHSPSLGPTPRLVTQTPDPNGREEPAQDTQGQVGHGAGAHPVQETGGMQNALHGFQPGLTTFVNENE